jgi:hypothetical protein
LVLSWQGKLLDGKTSADVQGMMLEYPIEEKERLIKEKETTPIWQSWI